MKRLTWRKHEPGKGKCNVEGDSVGYDLYYDDELIAVVRPIFDSSHMGFFWYTLRVPHRNTASTPVTVEEAKDECESYVRGYLE